MADVVLSAGDPSGIGPEVVRAAVKRLPRGARVRIFGDASLAIGLASRQVELVAVTRLAPRDRRAGRPTKAGGLAQLAYLESAARDVERGASVALVTAPVSKHAITRATGRAFLGHTEWLAKRAGLAPDAVSMCFTGGGLTVALATTHVRLANVAQALTRARIVRAARQLHAWLSRIAGAPRPRILVCALNPHAGEGGLVGDEEVRVVVPAIRAARRALGRGVEGPVPADAAFRLALGAAGTGVVALYHDQATIPVKLVAFRRSANVTLGLPYLRTSVDHGVAYDLAGRGTADSGGLETAIRLACRHGAAARRIRWTTGPK